MLYFQILSSISLVFIKNYLARSRNEVTLKKKVLEETGLAVAL